jgi:hypothetical protein
MRLEFWIFLDTLKSDHLELDLDVKVQGPFTASYIKVPASKPRVQMPLRSKVRRDTLCLPKKEPATSSDTLYSATTAPTGTTSLKLTIPSSIHHIHACAQLRISSAT